MSKNWFEIDNAGWKRMNAGRPPYELVKELIQNILDEDFNVANIDYGFKNGQFTLSIEDDINMGIKDSSLITTVFMTDKEDSHLKRGRKGRGLKEFLSVCDSAIVETVNNTVEFCEDGTRKEYSNTRTIGTKISCIITSKGWTRKAVNQITKFLNKIIIYGNGSIYVNSNQLKVRNHIHSIQNCLMDTQVIKKGVQVETREQTTINVYLRKDKKGWLYEMGIPVTEIDIPYDIDIQQRIPLNDNRNEIDYEYLNDVKFHIVRGMLSSITKDDLLGWASNGIQNSCFPQEEKQTIALKIVGNAIDFSSTVIKTHDKKMNDKAKQKGYAIFDVSSMNYQLRQLMTNVFKTSDNLIEEIENNCIPVVVKPNEDEKKYIEEHKKLVKDAIGLNIDIKIVEKPKDLVSDTWTEAFYSKGNVSELSELCYNRLAISNKTFKNPYALKAIDLLIHELGHEKCSCHDQMKYIHAVTHYGAKISIYFLKSNTQKQPEKKVRNVTLKDEIKQVLTPYGFNYMTLNDIYSNMNVFSTNEKAGIRSTLNRNCLEETSIFEREPYGGKYRLRVV